MDFELAEPVGAALRHVAARSDTGYAGSAPELAQAYATFAAGTWGQAVDPGQVVPVTDSVWEQSSCCACQPASRGPQLAGLPAVLRLDPRSTRSRHRCPTSSSRPSLAARSRRAEFYPDGQRRVPSVQPSQNRSGPAHTAAELAARVEFARERGAIIISDEIHAPLALPGTSVCPVLTVSDASDLAFALTSASKASNLAGLKCALIVTDSAVTAAAVKALPPDTRWRVGHQV